MFNRNVVCSFFLMVFLVLASSVWANGIGILNVALSAPDTTYGRYEVSFDVTWQNSWRDAGALKTTVDKNWDAAWVFAKFSIWNSGTKTWGPWTHCTLTASGHTPSAGSVIEVGTVDNTSATKGVGAFIHRAATNESQARSILLAPNLCGNTRQTRRTQLNSATA